MSSPRAQSSGVGDVRVAREMTGGMLAEMCWHERVRRAGDGVQRGCRSGYPGVSTPVFFQGKRGLY
jgi:hypothetical protein